MALNEFQVKEIVKKINGAVINPLTIHPLDETRVRRLFKDILKDKAIYDMSDLETILSSLGSEYSEYSKKTICHVAEVQLRKFQRINKA